MGVGSLAAAESSDNVHETAVELDPPLAAAGLLLLLLLLLHLGGLSLDLAGTGQRSVHLSSHQQNVVVQLNGGQGGDEGRALQRGSLAGQANVLGIDAIDLGQLDLQSSESKDVIREAFQEYKAIPCRRKVLDEIAAIRLHQQARLKQIPSAIVPPAGYVADLSGWCHNFPVF